MDEIVQNKDCVFRVIACSDRPPQGSQKNQGLFVEQGLGLGCFCRICVHELVERIAENCCDTFLHLALVSVYNFMG